MYEQQDAETRGLPTLWGGAIIASGYTPDALAGALPLHPGPYRGERKPDLQKRKTAIITARMTPKDKASIEKRAKQAGMTVTDYLTVCALGKEIIRVEGLDAVLSELKAQGRNLNQLTALANMGRLTLLRSDDLIDGYTNLFDQLQKIIQEAR